MSENEITTWLTKEIRHYIPLKESDAKEISSLFKVRLIVKGDFLLKEGQYGGWWGFIYKGLLRSYSNDENRIEHTNAFFLEGAFTCELVSFSGAGVSPTSVVALEDTCLIYVDKLVLERLYKTYPEFERFGRLLYEKNLVEYKQRNLFRVRLNARDRYTHFLRNEPELVKRVPLKFIASYLNVTDTSLSRIRRTID